jgi:hypothetical protein
MICSIFSFPKQSFFRKKTAGGKMKKMILGLVICLSQVAFALPMEGDWEVAYSKGARACYPKVRFAMKAQYNGLIATDFADRNIDELWFSDLNGKVTSWLNCLPESTICLSKTFMRVWSESPDVLVKEYKTTDSYSKEVTDIEYFTLILDKDQLNLNSSTGFQCIYRRSHAAVSPADPCFEECTKENEGQIVKCHHLCHPEGLGR